MVPMGGSRPEGKARGRRGGHAAFLAAFAVLLLVAAAPGRAEMNPAPYSLTPFVGGYTFEGNQDLKTSPVFGVRLGAGISRTWGVEGVFHYVPADSDRAGVPDTDVFNYRIDALYHLLPGSRLVPYLAAGIGILDHRPDEGGNETEGAFNYGAGLKYYLSDTMLVRGDVRHLIWLDNPHHNNLEYTLGLGFLFGARAPAPAAAVPPPALRPTLSLLADPRTIEPGRCATLTWSSTDADTVSLDPDIVAVAARGSRQVCPMETTRYTATATGPGGQATASETVTVTAPPPPAPPADSDDDGIPEKVSVRMLVEFDTDKSDIKPQYHAEIARVGEFMKTYPWTTAVIEGHTDNVGGARYNQALSQRRAEAVMKYLIDTFGIEPSRLTAKGYGLSNPIADNGTPEGRQKNRRIEAQITTTTRP
jgi:OmpA-OmpF porin, OOP family